MNLSALTAIQGANALAPLVVFPYALHALGSAPYAQLVMSESISQLLLGFVIFSFDINGVSRAVHLKLQKDHEGLGRTFSAIFCIRLLLYVAGLAVAVAFYGLVIHGPWQIMVLWSLVPLSYIFQSLWLFQGLEANFPAAITALFSRLACVGLMFWLVRGPDDQMLVPAIMGGCYLVGGLCNFIFLLTRWNVRLHAVARRELLLMVKDGKEIFLGNFSVSLYRDLNVLILGLVGVAAPALAAYSVAEKLIKCLQAVARPLNQLFFPRVIKCIHGTASPSRAVAVTILRQTVPQLAGLLLVTLGLWAAYMVAYRVIPWIARFPDETLIAEFVGIMMVSVFFGVVNYMLGIVGLNHLDGRHYLFRAILSVGVLSAVTCFFLGSFIGAYAGVYCFVGAEFFLMLIIARKYLPVPER